jgi:ABC-type ATPase involved in cell division
MLSKNMIFEEVALGLENRGIEADKIKERVFDTLKVCGLYEFRNWPISALSHGLLILRQLLQRSYSSTAFDYYFAARNQFCPHVL